jgi:hypothetical protein
MMSRSRSGLPEPSSIIAWRRRWRWPIILMFHHSLRNFPCSQRGSLLLVNLLSPATRRFSLYSALNLIQDPDQSPQHLLMVYHKFLVGPWIASLQVQGQDFQLQRQPPMCQLGTTVCLATAWLLQSQLGLLFLCSLLHLSHLRLHAHSSFLHSWATHHRFGWHLQFAWGQPLQCFPQLQFKGRNLWCLFS